MRKIFAFSVALMFIFTVGCKGQSEGCEDTLNSPCSEEASAEVYSETSCFSSALSSASSSAPSSPASSSSYTPPPSKPSAAIAPSKYDVFENKKKGWGQGNQKDGENRPVSCDFYQGKFADFQSLFIMPREEPKIYLTFDEGYENGYTSNILDTLKKKNCPAVFFVTMDYVKQNKSLVERMIAEGHTLGNHSVHHKSMPTLSASKMILEIAELHDYVLLNFGVSMNLFRPPMGEWSERSLAVTRDLGYKSVFWSYAYLDYDTDHQMGVEKAFPRVTNAAHNGAIYLLHAVSSDNAAMLGDVIDNFRTKGFSLEAIK
ncbi:MAG: polysaccharide deacetylase family protein [Oscillospiraceae bacterium]